MNSFRTALNSSARYGPRHHQFCAVPGRGRLWLFLPVRADGDYLLLFRLGGGAVTLPLAIELVMALTRARKTAR
jgi:hypothetical protein